jgi:hypothetical protein
LCNFCSNFQQELKVSQLSVGGYGYGGGDVRGGDGDYVCADELHCQFQK